MLGGVPLLALRKELSNTMPNEKVVKYAHVHVYVHVHIYTMYITLSQCTQCTCKYMTVHVTRD